MVEVIKVKNLWRQFKTYKREAGFLAALKSLAKREYIVKDALKGISLSIKKGEIIGLIGPNGAGKSTLIKILSGVLYPTKGEVDVLGFVPWQDRIKYTKDIGVVFGQKTQLWWDIPAIDSFDMNRGMYEVSDEDYKERLDLMAKLLEIEEIMKKPVRQLSLGERMRCEVVQALLHNPKIVFLDEPSIGLDIIAKERMREFILEMNKKHGTTFIITTHDMGDIEKLCERIIIINHGRTIYDGSVKDVRKKFANRKIIHCKFSEPTLVKSSDVGGCRIITRNRHESVIEVDLHKVKLRNVIDNLMRKYGLKIEDMGISEPPIEEIIALIYRK